ncbi:17547_t:CDS:1, partial [Acaulospora morrowiae]
KIIETCCSHLKCSSQVNSELAMLMEIYRRALFKFHELIKSNQHSEINKNFRGFVIEHLYHLSSICDDSHRSDQKIYLNLLIDLYGNLDKNTEVYAEIITLLSFAERNASNYSRHLELLQEAHIIKSRLYESDSPFLAMSLLNLARAFGDIKNTAKQREYSAKGLEILKKDYDSNYDVLTSEEKTKKEVDIVNAMMNFATGHVWFNNSLFVKLLEECLDFYNSHSLNRPDVKEVILSKLINAYITQNPDKALEIYQQWESLQGEHYQEGTQAYAFNVGLVLTNTGMALSKKSINTVLNMFDSTDISDETVSNAKRLNLQARQIAEKAIRLLAAFYPNNHYIFKQASDALTGTGNVENILRSIQKSIEGVRLFRNGNLDQGKIIFQEIFEETFNQEMKGAALAGIAKIEFIQFKQKGNMTNKMKEEIFKKYQNAITIYDSANVRLSLAIAYFVNDYHEQAIIHAENAIQRLPVSSIVNESFEKSEIPVLPIILQMLLKENDKIKDIPIKFLARYIIITSASVLGHTQNEMRNLEEFSLLLSSDETAIPYLLLGFCYQRKGDWRLALETFSEACQRQPYFNLSQISFVLSQFCNKFLDKMDPMDLNIFREIRLTNAIILNSNLLQQLIFFINLDTPIDLEDIKCFVKKLNIL